MSSLAVSAVVFVSTLGGACLGMWLRRRLPDHHLCKESQDIIRVATGLIGSMAALVLGLLVAAANGEFNSQKSGFQDLATNIMLLDRALAQYGPEAKPARDALHNTTALLIEHLWPGDGSQSIKLDSSKLTTSGGTVYEAIRQLNPETETQRSIQSQSLGIANDVAKVRWRLAEADDESLPRVFLVVLNFWLAGLFVSFGLFAPSNTTVFAALVLCSLSVAGAVFLVVDLDEPFGGLIQISSHPLRNTLDRLGK